LVRLVLDLPGEPEKGLRPPSAGATSKGGAAVANARLACRLFSVRPDDWPPCRRKRAGAHVATGDRVPRRQTVSTGL